MNDICILFPGEGAEYIGMGKSLYDNYPEARKIFDIANRTLGYKLSDIIFYGSNESLSDQRVLQPAILTTSFAYYNVLKKKFDISAKYFFGYGLGEITALVCAGVISFPDAVDLVFKRGNILNQEGEKDYMLNLQLTQKNSFDIFEWIELFAKDMEMIVTGYISERCYRVCVPFEKKRDVMQMLKENNVEVKILKSNLPLNCYKLQEASQKFQHELWGLKMNRSSGIKQVVSGINGKVYNDKLEIARNLADGMSKPVHFDKVIQQISLDGKVKLLDVGPSSMFADLIKDMQMDKINLTQLDLQDNAYYCLSIFKEKKLFNKKFLLGKMNAVALSIENKCHDDNEYKAGVIVPYSRMKQRYSDLIIDKSEPEEQDIINSKKDLIMIMRTKGLNENEIDLRLKMIENETLLSL